MHQKNKEALRGCLHAAFSVMGVPSTAIMEDGDLFRVNGTGIHMLGHQHKVTVKRISQVIDVATNHSQTEVETLGTFDDDDVVNIARQAALAAFEFSLDVALTSHVSIVMT